MQYPEGTHRDDMLPLDALDECYDLWASGAWPESNAGPNLEEVMDHVARLLKRRPAARMITPGLRRFFEAEIRNEREGGVTPSTLTSAIDSLAQGGADIFNLGANDVIALALIRDQLPGSTEIADLLDEEEDEEEPDGAPREQWEVTEPPEVYATDDEPGDLLGGAKR